ncbi:antibiotic biosynthesis monooxygenase [Streptomyces sp. AJS327]|uniref:putative quinol monooxygenase n=1 Tax=Streptomyces sp. AJS327 TaxID=2545265 RepID=UPI0015DF6417|nr:antibiotic biosynthesis monooxygenase family protein [Streptomyces sp. AJS327]MBA0052390.1 antibiotic biosynthesis monooxygenase [Streptomyces sp. AJS327]
MSHVVVARYRTLPDRQDEVLALLDTVATASRQEPGNLGYRVHQATDDPRTILLYEEYRTAADFETHRATEHFQHIVLFQVVPLLEDREVLSYTPRAPQPPTAQ